MVRWLCSWRTLHGLGTIASVLCATMFRRLVLVPLATVRVVGLGRSVLRWGRYAGCGNVNVNLVHNIVKWSWGVRRAVVVVRQHCTLYV